VKSKQEADEKVAEAERETLRLEVNRLKELNTSLSTEISQLKAE
jgi:FtsZ-binding cell division protein ZapB